METCSGCSGTRARTRRHATRPFLLVLCGGAEPHHILTLSQRHSFASCSLAGRSLAGRPFLVDTGDSQLDTDLSGLRRVLSGYREEMLYPVSWKAE